MALLIRRVRADEGVELQEIRLRAHDSGVGGLDLWVTAGNEPAHRLYESAGFKLTGDAQLLPSDPSKVEVRMCCVLR